MKSGAYISICIKYLYTIEFFSLVHRRPLLGLFWILANLDATDCVFCF
jgi:hypothetical protein